MLGILIPFNNGHLIIYFQVDGLVNTLGEDDMALAGKLRYEYPGVMDPDPP